MDSEGTLRSLLEGYLREQPGGGSTMTITLLAILKWLGIIALCGIGLIVLLAIGCIIVVYLFFACLSLSHENDSVKYHHGDEIPP